MKLSRVMHRLIGRHLGWGNPVPSDVWDEQYKSGVWDYLGSDSEESHYEQIAVAWAEYPGAGSVLDVGCGHGELVPHLRNLGCQTYYGIDISESAISIARSRFPELGFESMDVEKFIPVGKYDCIIFNESLYYCRRPLHILKRIERAISPRGCLIISMCDYAGHDAIWNAISANYTLASGIDVENERGQTWRIRSYRLG